MLAANATAVEAGTELFEVVDHVKAEASTVDAVETSGWK